ncbi:MAG TPA: GTPase Era [Patescibacteria group bacterium]|nr:GTPase Era [Patescibacteria group bacterium]
MKAGFVTLFGRSNVGKSTLLNSIVGTKLAITSPKPQTTRHQIQGVVHDEKGQIVFVDTPGIFTTSKSNLAKYLNKAAANALNSVDVILHVVDPTRAIGPEDKKIMSIIENTKLPKILVINKIDLIDRPHLASFRALAEDYDHVVEVSAKSGQHTGSLSNAIFELLQKAQKMYEFGELTNLDNDFWFAELIREKLFLRLREEVPYSVTVKVDEITVRPDKTLYIAARVITNADRYKSMIIGLGGRGIREIGQSSRKELEGVTRKKVYLDLKVVVDEHWTEEFKHGK